MNDIQINTANSECLKLVVQVYAGIAGLQKVDLNPLNSGWSCALLITSAIKKQFEQQTPKCDSV